MHVNLLAGLDALRQRETVEQRHVEEGEKQKHGAERRDRYPEETTVRVEERSLVVGATREKNREDEQHHDAAGVDSNLDRAEELVAELEIEHGGSDQHEQQICGCAENLA